MLLFSISMYVLAVSNDSSQVKTTGTAMVVSLVASIVALIGTFVTYWKFRRQLFTDTITSLSTSSRIGESALLVFVVYWH